MNGGPMQAWRGNEVEEVGADFFPPKGLSPKSRGVMLRHDR